MKPHRIVLIASLSCLLAAAVWFMLSRGSSESHDQSGPAAQDGGSETVAPALRSEEQTPVVRPVEEDAEPAAEEDGGEAAAESSAVQYRFQNWEDAMGAYAQMAGEEYDRYKALPVPESVFDVYNRQLQTSPEVLEALGWTREKEAEEWVRMSAVQDAFRKLFAERKDLLDAMEPFLDDIPPYEWDQDYVLARAGRIPLSEAQDLLTLPDGSVINWDEYGNKRLIVKYETKSWLDPEGVRLLNRLEAKAANPQTPLSEYERLELEEMRSWHGTYKSRRTVYDRSIVEGDPSVEEVVMDLGKID